MWDPDISISQRSPKRFHCAVQFGNQHTTFSPGTVAFIISEEFYDSWVSLSFAICKVETLEVWQTRIYPLQAQGRRVLMPQNFELRVLEGNLLLQSQLELGDPTPNWACCKTFIMFISNQAFVQLQTRICSHREVMLLAMFVIVSGWTSWVSSTKYSEIIMEWGAWGAAKGTKENRSWKKMLWLGGNWDSFISLPDL